MRRQRLRAGQAHSVCAFCASRLARDAARLPPCGSSALQTRRNSRLAHAFNPDGSLKSDAQPSAEGNCHPAATHASPIDFSDTSKTQAEERKPPESSAGHAADDLSFMDVVGAGRESRQQSQSEQSHLSARSTTQQAAPDTSKLNSRVGLSESTSGDATQTARGNQHTLRSLLPSASPGARQQGPSFQIRFNAVRDPPKGSRFDPDRASSWSHLRSGQSRDQSRQNFGQRNDNALRKPRDRDSQPMTHFNGFNIGQGSHKSSAYNSQEFSNLFARLGSKGSQQQKVTSETRTGATKPAQARDSALYHGGDKSFMSFADYNGKASVEKSMRQTNFPQQPASGPKEESLDELDFTQMADSPRPTSATAAQKTPMVPDPGPASKEDYHDQSDELDFTGSTPATRTTSRFRQTSERPVPNANTPEEKQHRDAPDDFGFTETAPRSRPGTSQQTSSPVAKSAPRNVTTESAENFSFTHPQSASQWERTHLSHKDAPKYGWTKISASEFFHDDAASSQQRSAPTLRDLWDAETRDEPAARRVAAEPQTSVERPLAMPDRTAWRPPPEEPQRKSRSSRFVQGEVEVDDGRRKRKDRRSPKMTDEDFDIEDSIKAEAKAERKAKRKQEREARRAEDDKPTPLYLPEYITVSNFANLLKVRSDTLLKKMEEFGYEDVRHDDILNAENACLIASEFNFEPIPPLPEDMELYPTPEPEDRSMLPLRPPVVTIMGHVDHGKTTLLDFLRKSSVAASEFGGITQHIGAFNVPLSSGKTITFLDTPGHAAFLNMRQRGANVTDIVILVVAADDGVKAQTEEAIKHAQSAGVPIIVAMNKIDKPGADVQRVKQDLARYDIYVEDFGGDIQAIPVSGKTGQGMQDLEEATSLLSEVLDHRADPTGPAEGHIIEASTKERGRVATVLIRRGTLKVGDIIVAGTTFARVRTMRNEAGVELESVEPGMPAEIDGWRGQPEAGDEFLEAPNEQRAHEAIEYRIVTRERIKMAKDMEAIAETRRLEHEKREKEAQRQELIRKAVRAGIKNPERYAADQEKAKDESEGKQKREEVPFILKADVSGSEEACRDYIMTVGNNEVCPKIARSGVGPVSEFDVEFASVAKGHIVAFNVEIPQHVRRLAGYHGVNFIENNVIYRLVDDIKKVLEERLPPIVTHKVTGELKILQAFDINVVGRRKTTRIAGCRVENGMIERKSKVKVFRGNDVIYQGTLSSLKNVKRDVSEMRKDTECGVAFDDWDDFQEGDAIQCFEEVHQKRFL